MKTFIINVKTDELRRAHMLNQIDANKCLSDFLFVHDGDMDSITPVIQNKYFGGDLNKISPNMSCAYKHILVYNYILDNNLEHALVLEDDIYLHKNFCTKLSHILTEIEDRHLSNYVISLEDSNLEYVKGSELKKNTLLYKKQLGRTTGAYLVDKQGAYSLIQEVLANKCNLPIDWFHNYCSSKELINIYWAHPVLSTQGSLNGKLSSLIDQKKTGRFRVLTFKLSRFYKRLLYTLR